MALLLVSCGPKKKEVQLVPTENFNTEVDGKKVSLYTLHNGFLTMQVKKIIIMVSTKIWLGKMPNSL